MLRPNAAERASFLLPRDSPSPRNPNTRQAIIDTMRGRIMQEAGGVQVKAAELLGMSFRSFRYYVKKYNLR